MYGFTCSTQVIVLNIIGLATAIVSKDMNGQVDGQCLHSSKHYNTAYFGASIMAVDKNSVKMSTKLNYLTV